MQTFLSTEGELLRWKGQGLPTDKLSSENAIVILIAHYTPLIVDPSSQVAGHASIQRRPSPAPLRTFLLSLLLYHC